MKGKQKNKEKITGITLIALVVTIVVLLILAAITINLVLSDDGIFKKTEEAKEKHLQGEQNDLEAIDKAGELIDQYLSGKTNQDDEPREKIADLMGKPADSNKNTPAEDEYGNKITIPAGFTIVPDTEENDVEYNYTGKTTPEGSKIPSVQDGIVIQDGEGNQFVWIPVGNIANKAEDSRGKTTPIDLARYTFDIVLDPDTYKITGGSGATKNKVLDGRGIKGEWEELGEETYEYLEELATSTTYDNTKAKDIEGFKTSATTKGGYYLARYEASKITDETSGKERVGSKSAEVWNYVTQSQAAQASRAMYTSNYFKSDLTNSYAWDTAIVFIQTYGGEGYGDYSKHTSKNTSLANTGVNGDKVCNIHDMASNCLEWTTETCTVGPCTRRGGSCYFSGYAARRGSADFNVNGFSFRPTLYVE